VIGIDHLWTRNAHAEAKAELDVEQEKAKELEADIKRKEELENELKQAEERIKVIKQLRAEQKGPVAMMSAINERMPGGQADFKLLSVTQKGNRLQVVGTSTDQQVIANFSRQLEFSNGLFTKLMLSVESKEVKAEQLAADPDRKVDGGGGESIRVFQFTIDCDFNKPRAEGGESNEAPAKEPAKGK
jgi:Tfp pilus assembly protein PilN